MNRHLLFVVNRHLLFVVLPLCGFVLSGCSTVEDGTIVDHDTVTAATTSASAVGGTGGASSAGASGGMTAASGAGGDTMASEECVKPGPNNTGPTEPNLLVPSGSITITQDGAVIENVFVKGTMTVEAANVTIRNFRIDGGGDSSGGGVSYGINVKPVASNVLIEDGEIFGISSSGLLGANFTARRINIHHSGGDAIKTTGNNLVESCWVHHLGMNPDAHADGNQTRVGSNFTFRCNFFDMPIPDGAAGPGAPFKSNAASINQAKAGNITNMVFDRNWMNGGGYTLYITAANGYTFDGCTVTDNRFGRDYRFGPLTTSGPLSNIHLSGNVWDDTDELMSIND